MCCQIIPRIQQNIRVLAVVVLQGYIDELLVFDFCARTPLLIVLFATRPDRQIIPTSILTWFRIIHMSIADLQLKLLAEKIRPLTDVVRYSSFVIRKK